MSEEMDQRVAETDSLQVIEQAIREGNARPTPEAIIKSPRLRDAYVNYVRARIKAASPKERGRIMHELEEEVDRYFSEIEDEEFLEEFVRARSHEFIAKYRRHAIKTGLGTTLAGILGSVTTGNPYPIGVGFAVGQILMFSVMLTSSLPERVDKKADRRKLVLAQVRDAVLQAFRPSEH